MFDKSQNSEKIEAEPPSTFNIRSELTKYIRERKSFSDSVKDVDTSFAPRINFVEKFEEDLPQDEPEKEEFENIENSNSFNTSETPDESREKFETKKDDAVLITDKPDPDLLPKVKKIAPSIFEKLGVDSDLAHKLLNRQSFNNNAQVQSSTKENDLLKPEQQKQSNFDNPLVYDTDLSRLKDVYISKEGSIQPIKQQNIGKLSSSNRANPFTSLICALLVMLESIVIYYSSNARILAFKFMFTLIPILALIPVIIFAFRLNSFTAKIDKGLKPYLILQFISLIGVLIIFALNMMFGMDFTNIGEYVATFTLPSIALATLPLYKLMKYILYKNLR